jgi:hypothetical protein
MNPTAIPLPTTEPLATLDAARAKLRGRLAAGKATRCACCGQVSKIYARGLYDRMVAGLAAIAEAGERGSGDATRLRLIGGGDLAKLVHWGLIERHSGTGNWVATPDGLRFLRGELSVPHRALIYGDVLIGMDTSRMIDVHDVKSRKVDLPEILGTFAVQEAMPSAAG